jgi:hypothetical protein
MWDFVVDKVALGQVFSEYFGFPCQSSFHQLLYNHPHLSSGVCIIGQKWPRCRGYGGCLFFLGSGQSDKSDYLE